MFIYVYINTYIHTYVNVYVYICIYIDPGEIVALLFDLGYVYEEAKVSLTQSVLNVVLQNYIPGKNL